MTKSKSPSRLAYLSAAFLYIYTVTLAPAAEPATPASAPAPDTFRNWDKNQDGKLTTDELPEPVQKNFARFDADKNGSLSQDEFKPIEERRKQILAARQGKPSSGKPAASNTTATANTKGQGQAPANTRLPENVKLLADIQYADSNLPAQRLDLLLPEKRETEAPLPVVVFIHGGGWRNGTKDGGRRQVAPYVASGRYIGVSVEYRLSGEAIWPAQIHDCKAAIRWIKAHAREYNLNPDKIGVWGTSAGGHLVSMLGVSAGNPELEGNLGLHTKYDTRVACVADYFGPADLNTMGGRHNQPDSPPSLLLGAPLGENPDKARAASPLTYVSEGDAPVFIAHGEADPTVPFQQSLDFAAALEKAKVPTYLQTITKGAHGGFDGPKLDARLRDFFSKYLRGEEVTVPTGTLQVKE